MHFFYSFCREGGGGIALMYDMFYSDESADNKSCYYLARLFYQSFFKKGSL